jgi:hypothetical protein
LDEGLNVRKLWISESAEGHQATCSDCAWNHPASGWGARGPAAEEVQQTFEAHLCGDYPRSRPRNPAVRDRRARAADANPEFREWLRSLG